MSLLERSERRGGGNKGGGAANRRFTPLATIMSTPVASSTAWSAAGVANPSAAAVDDCARCAVATGKKTATLTEAAVMVRLEP